MKAVFELVDVSDEEAYYPLGLFLSIQDAIAITEAFIAEHNEPPHEDNYDDGDVISLIIRERTFGLTGIDYSPQWSRKWQRVWDDEDYADDGRWVELAPESATKLH